MVNELGIVFDAPEDGNFIVAIDWDMNYKLRVWRSYFIFWGYAQIEVKYVLYSSYHTVLESKTITSIEADNNDPTISGDCGKTLYNEYPFIYLLDEGTSYIIAVVLKITLNGHSAATGTDISETLCLDVDCISVYNGGGSPY